MQRAIVGIGGFASNVGKTELMCELLRLLPGWEAIKSTRGHYRSCGKDSNACCVSHLLANEPSIRSGREENYTPGKDTARYWDAGAANVHWVIATEAQVEKGIKLALERVSSTGVLIEGNSFAQFVETDYFVLVARPDLVSLKSSARRMLGKASALYISEEACDISRLRRTLAKLPAQADAPQLEKLPVYREKDIPWLASLFKDAAGTASLIENGGQPKPSSYQL